MASDLMSTKQVAEFLGITIAGVRRAKQKGRLKDHVRGFYLREEVLRYQDDHLGQPGRKAK